MATQIEDYLLSLAYEYLELVHLTTSGLYDGAEYRELDSQRTSVHDELIRILGDDYARPFDMAAHCRSLVSTAFDAAQAVRES